MIPSFRSASSVAGVVAALVVVACLRSHAEDPAPGRDSRAAAARILDAHLAPIARVELGRRSDIESADLAGCFGDLDFFALRFPLYPVGTQPPQSLASRNLFAVGGTVVTQIADDDALARFFVAQLRTAQDAKQTAATARCWLTLAQHLHQDGYFRFGEPIVTADERSAQGTLPVVPERGNKGELAVQLFFANGRLERIEPSDRALAGTRPLCQATRLLDPDPVVREIMRRDLLVMGHAAKAYLDEVRGAADPALRRAIDDVWEQIVREGR